MPKYDFKCEDCAIVVEIKKSFDDRTPEICEICKAEMVKQLSVPGIAFKGSGFYSTDNRKK